MIDSSYITFKEQSTVIFDNNTAAHNGGVLYTENNCNVTIGGNSTITANNNQAMHSGGALYIGDNSYVTSEVNSSSVLTINGNRAIDGGALHIRNNSNFRFEGNSTAIINNNQAVNDGGAFYICCTSSVIFGGMSTLTINNSSQVKNGGAFCIKDNSNIRFEGNSIVNITTNQATYWGGALYIMNNSNFTSGENSTIIIQHNQAGDNGGAVYVETNSYITFGWNSRVTVNNNQARYDGGALYAKDYSNILFKENSMITINNNDAKLNGGALYISDNSDVTFDGNLTVKINNNQATNDGGALYAEGDSDTTFVGSSTITIANNRATYDGGAIYIRDNSDVTIKGHSKVTVRNNQATYHAGALYTWKNSNIRFAGNCVVTFDNNTAKYSGGVSNFRDGCMVFFEENSLVKFHSNKANTDGGALFVQDNCNVTIKGNSSVLFSDNEALSDGGAVYVSINSDITFQDNSIVKFINNRATYFGGALRFIHNSNITFENNCTLIFSHNKASQGGAIFTLSNIVFKENSSVQFDNNKATLGGALHTFNLTFKGSTEVTFNNNEATLNGGALYTDDSSITMKQHSMIIFTKNSAKNGGAIFISSSMLLVTEYSHVTFVENTAGQDGGAIHFSDHIDMVFKNSSPVTLSSNNAGNHGGAIYSKITQNTNHFFHIKFSGNKASGAGNVLYIDVPKLCNSSCLTNRIVGISNDTLQYGSSDKKIATSPNVLKLDHPVQCINNDSDGCKKYYIDNIMLGQEIILYVCLLDYYNKPAEVTRFRIVGENHQTYTIQQDSEYVSISCNHTIGGISIIGNKTASSLPTNYSVGFASHTTIESARKVISVNLTVEISPCHPGFQYHSKLQKCECYSSNGIVSCSGSRSTIIRGYWFGHVTGIPTVTFCPINYCNFTCCKTTNGYYHLSPVRINQCKLHRSGAACGSEDGHTLSFDSVECISISKCSVGQKILVVILAVIYWFAVVVVVFIVMYYQVGIGYFYALTYFYSIADILLSQHTDLSNGLNVMVTVMSSIAKVTPQFLGQLCFLENLSGIDQQFMHYIHPLAISMILIILSWLARHSRALSVFISRGIIRAVCFLLLLSYTSVATTSLLLLRSLTFADVDNVYTYLSPDIKYFRGRHLAYGITATILALLIVIGLPLLLLLEPFLNSKINFTRIKPLLDQFQGCYKDKYRWFAAYYMICRLITITIIIANLPEAFISRYLMITASTIISLIHLVVKPYVDNVLNMSDGAILHLMVLVTALPLFEYFDTFDSSLVVGIAIVLVVLPSVLFVVMKLLASKQTLNEAIKKILKRISLYNKAHEDAPVSDAVNTTPNNNFDLIIDENMRKNATVCEM